MEKNRITRQETAEMVRKFSELSEHAKYPPFSVAVGPNRLLSALNKKFESYMNGADYDSFESVEMDFAEEISQATAYEKIFENPLNAQISYLKKYYSDLGAEEEMANYSADNQLARINKHYVKEVRIIPEMAVAFGMEIPTDLEFSQS